jgi:hypothetical protein
MIIHVNFTYFKKLIFFLVGMPSIAYSNELPLDLVNILKRCRSITILGFNATKDNAIVKEIIFMEQSGDAVAFPVTQINTDTLVISYNEENYINGTASFTAAMKEIFLPLKQEKFFWGKDAHNLKSIKLQFVREWIKTNKVSPGKRGKIE